MKGKTFHIYRISGELGGGFWGAGPLIGLPLLAWREIGSLWVTLPNRSLAQAPHQTGGGGDVCCLQCLATVPFGVRWGGFGQGLLTFACMQSWLADFTPPGRS